MKYFIVFSFLILIPISSMAQQNRWKVGVQGGLSQINYVIHSSRINFGIESNNDYVALGGVNVTYGFSNDFTLRTGLIYERKGGSRTITIRTPHTSREVQTSLYYDYVTVPALSEFKILNKLPVFIVGGLNLSIPINVSEINITNHTRTHEHEPTPLQLAIMGGIGGELQIANKISLIFELSRKKSITKPETDMGYYVDDFDLFSTNLSAGIRYNL